MYKSTFGTKQQISFNSEDEYYELLGYLSKSDGSTKLVWEDNDEQGAWAKEGRILFFVNPPVTLTAYLTYTAGVGNVTSRVNCNEFVSNLTTNHNFVFGETQDVNNIRSTIPAKYIASFNRGLKL